MILVQEDPRTASPIRRFRSFKGQRYYSSWYWSSTVGYHLVHESRLELGRLLLADQDLAVTGITGQPLLLMDRDGRLVRRRTSR